VEHSTEELLRQIADLTARLTALEEEHRQLSALVWDRRQVDLVHPVYLGDIKIFAYMSDAGYSWMLHKTKEFQESHPGLPAPLSGHFPLDRVMEHYWQQGLEWTYVDVGCHSGATAILAAQYIRSRGKSNRVVAFECGPTRDLAPHNIELNGYTDEIVFEPLAIGNVCGPVIVYYEAGHTENSRIVNRTPREESLSYVIRATTLDRYARERQLGPHMIVKVDTQGGEYEVLQGMRETLASGYVSCIMEFTPWALETRIGPVQFLEDVGRVHHILDLYCLRVAEGERYRYPLIDPAGYRKFTDAVSSSSAKWTDVLLVPKALPGCEALLDQLMA
jgi:FkbM family methyltransferase